MRKLASFVRRSKEIIYFRLTLMPDVEDFGKNGLQGERRVLLFYHDTVFTL